jgi:hypothetical protein
MNTELPSSHFRRDVGYAITLDHDLGYLSADLR